jgi:surface protein
MFSTKQGFYVNSVLGPFSPLTLVANVSRSGGGANSFRLSFTPPTTSANINWGDGNTQTVTTGGTVTKIYTTGGNKTISIDGIFGAAFLDNKVLEVTSWGNSRITNASNMFQGATALTSLSATTPKFEPGCSTAGMFQYNTTFNLPIVSAWNVSNVTNMRYMFGGAHVFNQNLDLWDTSNVTNMSGMFAGASLFNGNISTFDTSNVTDMSSMFRSTYSFNQNLNLWDTSNVSNMCNMFQFSNTFNGDISTFDTSNVSNMAFMFNTANVFNGNLSTWDTSNVTDMNSMFKNAYSFNSNLSTLDTSKVTNMNEMFSATTIFNNGSGAGVRNTGLDRTANGGWKVGNVSNMTNMFNGAASANLPLHGWCVTNIGFKPTGFDTGALNIGDPYWGTCFIPD